MELSSHMIKNFLIFPQKSFPHISGNGAFFENFLYFRKELSEIKKLKKPTVEKFLLFMEMELASTKLKKFLYFF